MVVVMSPTPEDHPGVSEVVEHFFIQALVAKLAVEAFDEAVLLLFTRGDIVSGEAGLVLPFEDGAAGQFSPFMRCVRHQCQVLTRVVVDHAEHAEPPGRSEDIGHKVEALTLRRTAWRRHRFTRASRALAASPAFYRQSFLLVETPQFLVVHHDTLPFEHNANAPIAEPTARCCDLAHAFADIRIVRFRLTPDSFRIDADQSAGAALGDVVLSITFRAASLFNWGVVSTFPAASSAARSRSQASSACGHPTRPSRHTSPSICRRWQNSPRAAVTRLPWPCHAPVQPGSR